MLMRFEKYKYYLMYFGGVGVICILYAAFYYVLPHETFVSVERLLHILLGAWIGLVAGYEIAKEKFRSQAGRETHRK